MISKREKDNIRRARNGFAIDLFDPKWQKLTADDDQVEQIARLSELQDGRHYLDLATGNGYVAFKLADKNKGSRIVGIDIVEEAITQNNQAVSISNLSNLEFVCFDGSHFPFDNNYFHSVITRYAFHHFPVPANMIKEIDRVLEPKGIAIVSDPITSMNDSNDLANGFARLKNDGHVKYYMENELAKLFTDNGFHVEEKFYNEITFPRVCDSRYDDLIKTADKEMIEEYKIKQINDKVYITIKILNIKMRKAD